MSLPTVILPGFFASAKEYDDFQTNLNQLNIPTVTVPLRKRDWLATVGGRSVVPIIQQLDRTVKNALNKFQVSRVNLIGHSAGGWIARIYLGEFPYDIHGDRNAIWNGRDRVNTLVTLGTPHVSKERWTKRNLDFVKNNYPGAFYEDVNYVCVAGKAIYGKRQLGSWLAYNSYQLTCGTGNCWGDGITPVVAAHLEGANNITLENVRHSPAASEIWYGSREIIKSWICYLSN